MVERSSIAKTVVRRLTEVRGDLLMAWAERTGRLSGTLDRVSERLGQQAMRDYYTVFEAEDTEGVQQ